MSLRDDEIVKLLDSEPYPTLQEVGDMYSLTRERIRQIYKKLTGKACSHNREIRQDIKRRRHLNSVRFNCELCGEPVTYHIRNQKKFCYSCAKKRRLDQRDPNQIKNCAYCGVEYRPYRSRNRGNYCSRDCYFNDVRENGLRLRPKIQERNIRIKEDFEEMRVRGESNARRKLAEKYNLSIPSIDKIVYY